MKDNIIEEEVKKPKPKPKEVKINVLTPFRVKGVNYERGEHKILEKYVKWVVDRKFGERV